MSHSSGAAVAMPGGHFGAGQNGIWFDEVECSGDESSIVRCTYSGLANHNCAHSEDAGVSCGAPRSPTTVTNGVVVTPAPGRMPFIVPVKG